MSLSAGGGKPCIHPITLGSDCAAVNGPEPSGPDSVHLPSAAGAVVDIAIPAKRTSLLEVDDDIDEPSCPDRRTSTSHVIDSLSGEGGAHARGQERDRVQGPAVLQENIVGQVRTSDARD